MSAPITMSMTEFLTAGLEAEGVYRISIQHMAVEEREVQTGENAGQKYDTISGRVLLVERFGFGLLENQPSEFLNCGVQGKGLQRFKELYIAGLGLPTAGQPGTRMLTLQDMCAAVVGLDNIWTTYYWKRDRKNPDVIVGSLGWSFANDPAKLKAPKPFAERDKQSQAEESEE